MMAMARPTPKSRPPRGACSAKGMATSTITRVTSGKEAEGAVHLEDGHPVKVARLRAQELDAIKAAVRAAQPEPLAGLQMPGELAADLHAVNLLTKLVQARQEQLLE